ncbi:MAG: hypothetical protein LBK99_22165 [Opitutaceae bacterium]|nr:hypothetical protein [Opitutaceae bacterium]
MDTGFIVGLLDKSDPWHDWAISVAPNARGPWLTAEACIAECIHCLEGKAFIGRSRLFLFDWMERDLLHSKHFLPERQSLVFAEMNRYKSRYVDFADVCIVTLSDEFLRLPVFTTDSRDFAIYLRGRTPRQLFAPHNS